VGVGYGDDLKQAQHASLDIAGKNAFVLEQPAPFVQVASLGDSSVNLTCSHGPIGDVGNARSLLLESIRNDIVASGLSLPYPQRDLHVYHHDADGGRWPKS
jgi:small-conductance mechanosensitive channel